MRFIFFILLISTLIYCQPSPIDSCNDLQNVILDKSDVSYYFTKDLDCSSIQFIPMGSGSSSFNGVIDGRGYKIKNITIQEKTDFTGIFSYINGATLKNIVVEDFNLTSKSLFLGIFSSYSSNSQIINCHIKTSEIFISNNFKGTASVYMGAFMAYARNSSLSNCSMENTFVNGVGTTGGMVGWGTQVSISGCVNIGIPIDNYRFIVQGQNNAGGIVSICDACSVVSSGIINGKVVANNQVAGGIAGVFKNPKKLDQLYLRPDATVIGIQGISGGISGGIEIETGEYKVSNCYSQGGVMGLHNVGGLFGVFKFDPNVTFLTVSDSYSSAYLQTFADGSIFKGAILGNFANDTPDYHLSFNNVFYDNDTFPPLGNSKTSTDGSDPVGFPCKQLYNTIVEKFPKKIWNGNRLTNEFESAHGKADCYEEPISDVVLGLLIGGSITISIFIIVAFVVYIYRWRKRMNSAYIIQVDTGNEISELNNNDSDNNDPSDNIKVDDQKFK